MIAKKWIFALFVIFIAVYCILPDNYDFTNIMDKRVLITGASGGIGEQITYVYCEFGANIVITARREKELKRVVENCKKIGNTHTRITFIVADMVDMKSHRSVVEDSVKSLNGLDHLILNHADVPVTFVWGKRESVDILRKTMDVNFISYASLAHHSLAHLKQANGSICAVNSLMGKVYVPFQLGYVASKFAMDGFFSSLRIELADYNVSITNCFLGAIDTDRYKSVLDDVRNVETLDAELGNQTAHKKIRGMMEQWTPASSKDTAYAVVKAVDLRYSDMYFPYFYKYLLIFRDILNKFVF